MSIDKDTVKHISKLARISLDEKKISSLSRDLSSIIKFIEKLNELNTEKTIPLTSLVREKTEIFVMLINYLWYNKKLHVFPW